MMSYGNFYTVGHLRMDRIIGKVGMLLLWHFFRADVKMWKESVDIDMEHRL